MRTVIAIFLMALSITALSIPWVRKVAIRTGFVDSPAKRKLHSTPMPLMGGVAIFGGAVLAIIAFVPQFPNTVAGVLLSLTVVALVGLLDDRYGLPAWAKLAGQLVGMLILAAFDIRVKLPLPEIVNYIITFLWLAGISNAINFLDNMDGLSAGVSGVAAAFIMLLGLQNDQFLVAGLAAAVLGACLGFLRFNFKPAQIFMGDAGSLFLGFLLALLGLQLRFPANSSFVTWMVPVFVLALPIFDTVLVVISRLRRGVSPNTAGKDHLSHRLVKRGFSQREAVLLLYLFTGAGGIVGVFITEATIAEGYLIFVAALLLGLIAIWKLDNS
ncbi:Undecaprenyl-phosphate alpha-N-acetylglucosaminyl 1-phosphate transferase [hydrothermal vent metagenome]|uniref:Undecaprenyl-phosphate alpha-N-acetylglucosaminyl 1-phosphate transferase n=1 Tax=hydrothermal vent metagenome TaxID=652676 RepID=A0A3B0V247_9ZZZZ